MLASIGFLIGTTLMYSTPLIFASLGGTVSENAGVVNIGLEGMMVIGAFFGAAIGYYAGNPWIGFLAAGIAGGLLASLHALACVTFAADHVVSGIAMNFLGPGFALFFSRLMFNGATQTVPLDLEKKINKPFNGLFNAIESKIDPDGFGYSVFQFFDQIFNQYATVYLAFLLVLIVWFMLYKTKLGLRIRSVGEHPKAADTLGINVYKVKYLAVILSGVFAGFGGAALSIAVVSRFSPTLISGQGYIALAAMIFGKWKPQGALRGCLLFGLAQGLVVFLGSPVVGISIPTQILAMLPYVITLVILVSFVGKAVAPSADGEAYEKGGK